jgi:nitrite reductase/ring-hydroxylating ferredoxin subunit
VPSWERAVPLADLSDRDSLRAMCGGFAVCLALADGEPVAVRDVCAHRETALSGGIVRDGILTCPGHFWRYDLRTGQCANRPDRVDSYPCRVTGGWVEVLVPDPSPALSMRQLLLEAARQRAARLAD